MSKFADFLSSLPDRNDFNVNGCLNLCLFTLFTGYLLFSGYHSLEPWFPESIFDFLTHEEILCMIFGTSSTSEIVWAFAVGILSAGIYLLSRYIKKESKISYVYLVFLFILSTLLTFRIYYTIMFDYNRSEIKSEEVIQTTVVHKYRVKHTGKRGHVLRVSNDIVFYVDDFITHKEIENYAEFSNYHVGDTINVKIRRGCLGYPTSVKNLKVWKLW